MKDFEKCSLCRFFEAGENTIEKRDGTTRRDGGKCHANPPQFVVELFEGLTIPRCSTWPDVTPDDWCGRFDFQMSHPPTPRLR